ncbi:uncharacterized protein LOC127805761 isoform X2 [Diospyros lotus]|nr:uncharacterized protein LOC127805761 isoform X2 [Diospyros lotus]XP_052198486.1 uncharacterized protein LOC127805761 isoform X2 [Diospyros lotus]XP_052198487.1 uncharacterized protein LOC127805761 isoform X2 [Diospyros lotus]
MSESEIRDLKEALCAQQQLLQKLYNELEMEREASASAASEALSMILRLQGEKAVLKMESNQYKRLAEEKMCHAEEALEIFQDLIYQREMEVASLDYQVEAYRYKLLSLGCDDIGVFETKFPENLLLRNENLAVDTSTQRIERRRSMPPIQLKFSYQKKGALEKELTPSPDASSKIMEENMKYELDPQSSVEKKLDNSAVPDINTYWEQIRKLDERVREIKGVKPRSPSLVSEINTDLFFDPAKGPPSTKSTQIKHAETLLENEATADPSASANVYDVFEVPQAPENDKGSGGQMKQKSKLALEGNERPGRPGSFPQEAVKSYLKDETLRVRKIFSSPDKNTLGGPSEGAAVDCHLALAHPGIGIAKSHPKFQQLKRSEIMEVESGAARQGTSNSEELKLLKEIQHQLNSIESEIRSWKTKKSPPSNELPLVSLTEAMLHFWL